MATKETNKIAMPKELAIEELHKFISKYKRRPPGIEQIDDDYPDVVDALMEGRLVLSDEPVYNLIEPVLDKTSVSFKTRVDAVTGANLAKGIDLQKDAPRYSLVMIAHITGTATVAELGKFNKFDYDTIRQLATVFI